MVDPSGSGDIGTAAQPHSDGVSSSLSRPYLHRLQAHAGIGGEGIGGETDGYVKTDGIVDAHCVFLRPAIAKPASTRSSGIQPGEMELIIGLRSTDIARRQVSVVPRRICI